MLKVNIDFKNMDSTFVHLILSIALCLVDIHIFYFLMAKENRMDVHNLAIVFSPNIIFNSPTSSGPALMLMHMEWNNRLVEILLLNADMIFEE